MTERSLAPSSLGTHWLHANAHIPPPARITGTQRLGQQLFGLRLAMHQTDILRPMAHSRGETQQAAPVGMRRIATEGVDSGTDHDALAIQIHITAARPVLLDDLPRACREPG